MERVMKKAMAIGIEGMLGHIFLNVASKDYDVVGTYLNPTFKQKFQKFSTEKLDITNKKSVESVVKKHSPDMIVNCAAVTDVDFCEGHPQIAEAVHVGGTKFLSEAADAISAKFIHISTDFIFDGRKGNYTEEDLPNPLGVYARTKYEGEKVVSKNAIIARTCIYGWNIQNKQSLVEWIINKLKKKEYVSLFVDSFFSPIYTGDFSQIILEMFEKNLKGIYHIAGSEKINKYNFGLKVAKVFNLNKEYIKPVKFDSIKRKAKRPKDTSLCCDKIKKEEVKLKNVEEGLKMMKNDRRI